MMVSMVGWCSECNQHDMLLDATLLAMMADTAALQIRYRQVCSPHPTMGSQVAGNWALLCLC